MRARWIGLAAVTLALVAVVPGPASAGVATETLQPAMDQVLSILNDATLKGPARTPKRRAALRAIMNTVIDFPDAARRALSVHWQARTEAERDEFVTLFKDLVTYSYIVTLEAYAGQTIVFVGEAEHDGITIVSTKVESPGRAPVPVEYRMHQRGARWLVYDVVVEGVSLVANYRAQFNTVVRTSSYDELVRRIRVRVAELTSPSSALAITAPARWQPWPCWWWSAPGCIPSW
jgi:phospholipid transport system substrate-binding protein